MRYPAEGTLDNCISICGHHIFPGYVIKGGRNNLMIEGGVNALGPLYARGIERSLDREAGLDYLFVTHVHYDHMGALPYLKRKIPAVKLGASEKAARIIKKDSVVKKLNYLSEQLLNYFGDISEAEEPGEAVGIDSVDFDCILKDKDRYDLGGITCEVYETPGHTKDHISFYLPEPEILFPGEALGNPVMEDATAVKVEFLSSYTDYIASMEKLMVLKPRIIAMSHLYFYDGYDTKSLFDRSYQATIEYRNLIEHYLDRVHGNVDEALKLMVRTEYDEKGNIYQERNAYVANAGAQIKAIAELHGGNQGK